MVAPFRHREVPKSAIGLIGGILRKLDIPKADPLSAEIHFFNYLSRVSDFKIVYAEEIKNIFILIYCIYI